MEQLTWHQWQAEKRNFFLRNHSAHIMRKDGYLTGLALCGVKDPLVQVAVDKRDNVDNKCCKTCKKIADKQPEAQ